MKNIAVLTSGGDSPGMNACIRAIVRSANQKEIKVHGIQYGYNGLINNDFKILSPGDVGNTIHIGGTILKSARSDQFRTQKGREKAYNNLLSNNHYLPLYNQKNYIILLVLLSNLVNKMFLLSLLSFPMHSLLIT